MLVVIDVVAGLVVVFGAVVVGSVVATGTVVVIGTGVVAGSVEVGAAARPLVTGGLAGAGEAGRPAGRPPY